MSDQADKKAQAIDEAAQAGERADSFSKMMREYTASFADELRSKMGRLDRMIGGAHWLSVGTYKERLVHNQLIDHVPKKYEVGTGFVMAAWQDQKVLSRQVDLLIWDSSNHSPFFRDGDFVVIPPTACKAAIEVKGHLDHGQLHEGLHNLLELTRFANILGETPGAGFHSFLFALDAAAGMQFPGTFFNALNKLYLKAPFCVEPKTREVKQAQFLIDERLQGWPHVVSSYWIAVTALLGKGVIRFAIVDKTPIYYTECVAEEPDLSFGALQQNVMYDLLAGRDGANRHYHELQTHGTLGQKANPIMFMPVPFSNEAVQAVLKTFDAWGVAGKAFTPDRPWTWSAENALAEHDEKVKRAAERERKKATAQEESNQ